MNYLFTLLFLFNSVILSQQYRPCQAFGVPFDDSKKASLRVRSLGLNRAFPLYAVPPVEDQISTLMTAPLFSLDFLQYLLIKLVNGDQAVAFGTLFTLTTIFVNVKIDTYSLIQQGSKLAEETKELKGGQTSMKTDIEKLGSKLDEETKEIKGGQTSMKTDMEELGSKLGEEKKEIKAELASFKGEIKTDMEKLGSKFDKDLSHLGSKLDKEKKEIKAELASFKGEIKTDMESFKGEIKTDVEKLGSKFDKDLSHLGSKLYEEKKEIKAELTSIKTDMEKQGKDLSHLGSKFDKDLSHLGSKLENAIKQLGKDMTELTSDTKIMGATMTLIKATQENQNEKMQIWADAQKVELDKMKLVMMEHENKSQEQVPNNDEEES